MSYDAQTKEDLMAEVGKRKLAGRTINVTAQDKKEDIIAALTLDDETKDNENTSLKASGIPIVESKDTGVPEVGTTTPTNYSGVYINAADGEPYGLAVVEDEPSGRTHFAKNSVHFWNGTKEEFKAQFDKK